MCYNLGMITASPPDKTKPRKNLLVKNHLTSLRLKAGLTQAALARKIGVRPHSVWNIENGQHGIADDTARLLCDALRCNPTDLLYIDFTPEKINTPTP